MRQKTRKSYDSFDDIFILALNILGRTDLTTLELRRKLLLKTNKANEVQAVIHRLTELDLLNDFERAKNIINYHPSWSGLRIKQVLYEKGVPKDIAESAVEELLDEDSERERAVLALKKLLGTKTLDEENRTKIFNSMLRRGFKSSIIKKIIDIDIDFYE